MTQAGSSTTRASDWRSNFAALAISTTVPSLAAYVYFVMLKESSAAQTVYASSRVFLVLFPVAWFTFVERGKWCRPAWRTKAAIEGVLFALSIGALAGLLYAFLLRDVLDTGAVREKATQLDIKDRYLLFAAFLSVVNSSIEEYYWRWFVFGRARRIFSLRTALLISGLAFAAHHFIVLCVFFGFVAGLGLSVAVGIGGAYWAWLYHRSGSLYACWLSHLIVDGAVLTIGWFMLFPAG